MNREDSALARGDEAVPLTPAAWPRRSFAVRFGQSMAYSRAPADTFRLVGDGELRFEGDRIIMAGKRRRPFLPGVAEQHAFDASRVVNVSRSGGTFRFELLPMGGKREFVRFDAKPEDALAIQRQLPAAQSPAFAKQQAEVADFHQRLDRLSPRAAVTPLLVAVNVAVFIAMCVAGVGIFEPDGRAVVGWGSNFGPATMGGQWWRLFTSMFLHFGVIHLAFNMWALYQSGRTIERLYGSFRFALLYLFAGLAGSMTSLLWNPQVNSAGASGAIFGIFGGLLAFVINPRNGVPAAVMQEQRNSTLIFTAYSLFYGFAHSGIDNAAHIGGLVGGFLIGLLLARPLDEDARARFDPARTAMALAGGVLALGLLMWPLMHPSDRVSNESRFQAALVAFSGQEQAALDATQQFFGDARSGGLRADAYLPRLERDVLPKWDAAYDGIAAAKLAPDNPQYPLQQALLQYLDGRRKALRLTARAAAQNDERLMEQAKRVMAETDAALARVNEIAKARK